MTDRPEDPVLKKFLEVLTRIADALETIADSTPEESAEEEVVGTMPPEEEERSIPPTIITGTINRRELEADPQ